MTNGNNYKNIILYSFYTAMLFLQPLLSGSECLNTSVPCVA